MSTVMNEQHSIEHLERIANQHELIAHAAAEVDAIKLRLKDAKEIQAKEESILDKLIEEVRTPNLFTGVQTSSSSSSKPRAPVPPELPQLVWETQPDISTWLAPSKQTTKSTSAPMYRIRMSGDVYEFDDSTAELFPDGKFPPAAESLEAAKELCQRTENNAIGLGEAKPRWAKPQPEPVDPDWWKAVPIEEAFSGRNVKQGIITKLIEDSRKTAGDIAKWQSTYPERPKIAGVGKGAVQAIDDAMADFMVWVAEETARRQKAAEEAVDDAGGTTAADEFELPTEADLAAHTEETQTEDMRKWDFETTFPEPKFEQIEALMQRYESPIWNHEQNVKFHDELIAEIQEKQIIVSDLQRIIEQRKDEEGNKLTKNQVKTHEMKLLKAKPELERLWTGYRETCGDEAHDALVKHIDMLNQRAIDAVKVLDPENGIDFETNFPSPLLDKAAEIASRFSSAELTAEVNKQAHADYIDAIRDNLNEIDGCQSIISDPVDAEGKALTKKEIASIKGQLAHAEKSLAGEFSEYESFYGRPARQLLERYIDNKVFDDVKERVIEQNDE